jgi:hypothetical protein
MEAIMERLDNAMAGEQWGDTVIRELCFNGGWFVAYDEVMQYYRPVVYVSNRFMDSHKYLLNHVDLVCFLPWENCG